MSSARNTDSSLRQKPRRYPRAQTALSNFAEGFCSLLGGRRIYRALNLQPGRFDVRHERILVPNLPEDLDGVRIAQLSDLHAGRFVGEGDLRAVVDEVNRHEVDVHVLTGDYITHHATDAFRLVEDLARLRSRFGGYAVFGNHDYRGRMEGQIQERFEQAGIRFLRNSGVRFEIGAAGLALTGVEDLEEGKHIDPVAARASLQDGDVEVLLCHNPRGGELLAREGCAVVLSGHTHGRQINLPGLTMFGPPHPGLRLQFGPTTLIVNRGLGVVAIPIRFRARAEVVIVTLQRGSADASNVR
jgi:predicted MPP superfamily phosphohydrolase